MSYPQDPSQPWGDQAPSGQAPWGQPQGTPPPQPGPGWGQQQGTPPPQPGPGWGQQPGYGQAPPGYQPYPPSPYDAQAQPLKQSSTLSTLSIVFGAVAFLLVPFGFGIAGLVCGIVAKSRDQPRATVGIVLSAVGLVVGTILGVVVAHTVV